MVSLVVYLLFICSVLDYICTWTWICGLYLTFNYWASTRSVGSYLTFLFWSWGKKNN